MKALTINLGGEVSRADHPLTPISDRNYHSIDARADYKLKRFVFSTGYKQNYNMNSISVSQHSARARNYHVGASWIPRDWFSLDASYSKLHLDTVSGIAFFAALNAPTSLFDQYKSIYVSNIYSASLMSRFVVQKRVDVIAGYTVSRDTGDGRSRFTSSDPLALLLGGVQTFPLRFESPLARVSLKLSSKLRWNATWQFYHYKEDFGLFNVNQNYRAHTGSTSLQWAF